jgi:predicted Zn-dependent protease
VFSSLAELFRLLERRNQAASEYNKVAKNYNQKYGHGLEFNQAEYNGKGINVYQFSTEQDLEVALAHEFGHALGMDHVENPTSIMYYITGGNQQVDLTPSAEDLTELKRVCKI